MTSPKQVLLYKRTNCTACPDGNSGGALVLAAILNSAQAQMGKAAMSRSEAAKDMRGQPERSMAGSTVLPCTSKAKEGSLLGLGAPTMGRGSHHLRSEEVQDNIDDQRPVLQLGSGARSRR
jgi:hypothetical protein